jgi:hypothetical protein
MSLIAVQGGATGTGTVTLLAPITNTNRTLTLPDVTGTVALQGGAGVGKVLQVVNATYATSTSNSTGTYADTGLTASITPTSASSKILVLANQNGVYADGNATSGVNLKLLRGATDLATFGLGVGVHAVSNLSFGSSSICFLDSPATTSATTYKTQFARASLGQVFVQEGTGTVSTITLMEIAA